MDRFCSWLKVFLVPVLLAGGRREPPRRQPEMPGGKLRGDRKKKKKKKTKAKTKKKKRKKRK